MNDRERSYFFRGLCRRARVLIPLLLLSGCLETSIPPAGSYSDVLLVTEEGLNDPLAAEMERALAKTIDYYVDTDVQFNVKFAQAENIDAVPYIKNIVFCGVADPNSVVGSDIRDMLGAPGMAKVHAGGHIFKKDDLPTAGQLTMIVTGESVEDIVEAIHDKGDEIRDAIEESCRRRIRHYLLKDHNEALTRRLRQEYGFTIEVPTLYDIQSEASKPPGIEFLRNGPSRSLGIFWADWRTPPSIETDAGRDALFRLRADYVRVRYDGDTMDSTRVAFRESRLGKYPAIVMEGYWSNARSVAGGFYRTYFVYSESEDLMWVVDTLVYAPGLPKHPLFRELLAIAETFRLP